MAIFDGLEIVLQDASSKEAISEFHTEDSHDSTTVRSVTRCIEVADGKHCSFKVRTLPDFQWHDGHCLRKRHLQESVRGTIDSDDRSHARFRRR